MILNFSHWTLKLNKGFVCYYKSLLHEDCLWEYEMMEGSVEIAAQERRNLEREVLALREEGY